jgi:hypothetical protein
MSVEEPLSQTEQELFKVTGESALADEGANARPMFKVIGDDKVPVSKELGKLWKHRKNTEIKRMERFLDAWSEAVRYYNHDHVADPVQNTSKGTRQRGDETENLVFSNISTLMPILYAQNPTMEFTNEAKGVEEPEEDKFASAIEHLVNIICNRKEAPGINLKSKIRKATLFALLCNCAWLKINWTKKAHSSEGALVELERISKEYKTAKDEKDLIELEGQLRAMEDEFSLAIPSGPSLKCVHPGRILIDADTEDAGLSDCTWLMEYDYLPTSYIKARYTEEKGEEDRLIYKPTHVAKVATEDLAQDNLFDNAFREIDGEKPFGDYGFKSDDDFQVAQYTKVWYVWDKLMQRMYMYHDKDWTYPIWVWNKPLPITRFFPYFCLTFHEGTDNVFAKGETTYYLDQQDAINEINKQQSDTRRKLRTKVIYDSNMIKSDVVDQLLNSDEKKAVGVAVPEGGKLDDVFQPITPVEVRFKEVFDKTDKYNAIDRIANINEIMRGQQLRTNTTQDAVQALQDASQSRIAEKQGKIEDLVADIVRTLSELCIQFMSKLEVEQLIGTEQVMNWPEGMGLDEFRKKYSLTIVAGTTEKPTSKVKQQQALQLGQVLGQFAAGTPAVSIVMLKVMEKAFSEISLTEKDWDMLRETTMQAMQGPQAGATEPPPEQEGPTPEQQELAQVKQQDEKKKNPKLGDMDMKKLFSTILKILPPEMKQGVEDAIRQGISPTDALAKLAEGAMTNGSGEEAPPTVQ